MLRLLLMVLLCDAAVVAAQPESSAPQPPVVDEQTVDLSQAQVIIRPGSEGQIEEYRMAGQLIMIKITPDKGVPYYLVDSDGDGRLDSRRSELNGNLAIPQWPILRWK